MSRRTRGVLRGGRPDPGSSGQSFSPEDLFMQRLYLGNADDTLFLINSSTRASQTEDTDPLTLTLNSEGAGATDVNIDGFTSGVASPKTFYNAAGCSWLMYDIFGNKVFPYSPVLMQWAVVLTDARASAGDAPPHGAADVRGFCSLGVTDRQVSSLQSGTPVASAGHYVVATGNPTMIQGIEGGSNMSHSISSGELGKVVIGTVTSGPKTGTDPPPAGTSYVSPVMSGQFGTADAGSGDGANTEAGQAITAAKFEQFDPSNNDTWANGNQLHWIFGMGRSHQTSTANTDINWKFRLYARAIPYSAISSTCLDLRLLGKTW